MVKHLLLSASQSFPHRDSEPGLGVTVTTTYDDLDRVRTRTFPDGGIESFGYTANVSGPTSYTNQLSKVTTYAYDKLGRKTTEITVGLATNTFTFDGASALLTLTDGKSQTTTWAYDLYGRVATKKYADGNTNLVYSYDASGRLTNRWSAAKGNTAYTYDAGGNLTLINYPTSADVSFAYDALNRSTNEIVTGLFTNAFTYHSGGALATEDGPLPNDTVTNLYNTGGLRSAMTVQLTSSTHFTNGYTYDSARRLSTLTSSAGSFTYAYFATNGGYTAPTRLIRQLTLPPGSYITNSFDNNARQTRTRLLTSGNSELNDHQYDYNAGSQRTKQTFTDDAYVSYTYDDASQLRTAYTTNSGGTEVTAQRYMFGYDAAWNMIKRTNNATVSTYTVNNLNQATSAYTFDSNGNPSAGGSVNYTFDDENRLIESTIPTGSGTSKTEFYYDARSRLRKRVDYIMVNSVWTVSATKHYVYDGNLEIQERSSTTTVAFTYTRGTDRSGSIQRAGGIGGLLARSNGSTHRFYHADANGNVTYFMTSAEGLAASYRYDPFGRTITSSGSVTDNSYRFSSKSLHTANNGSVNVYYYGYRFYDPNSQRWLNRDPIEETGDVNLYRFAKNQPPTSFDPDGRYVPPPQSLMDGLHNGDCGTDPLTGPLGAEDKHFPGNVDPYGGAYRHCVAACLTAKCQGTLGCIINRLWDLIHEDDSSNSKGDKEGERAGEKLAKKSKIKCEDACLGPYPAPEK